MYLSKNREHEKDKYTDKYNDGAVLKPRNCKMLTFQETQKTRF